MRCEVKWEELSRFAAGELDAAAAADVEEHVSACESCRERLGVLHEMDAVLGWLGRAEPSAGAVLETRRELSREIRGPSAPEIMTLEEVADFLRLDERDFDEIAGDLPAFEIAGRVRVRRESLLRWIERRERDYGRGSVASDVSLILAGDFGKGVA